LGRFGHIAAVIANTKMKKVLILHHLNGVNRLRNLREINQNFIGSVWLAYNDHFGSRDDSLGDRYLCQSGIDWTLPDLLWEGSVKASEEIHATLLSVHTIVLMPEADAPNILPKS
jgi:hypothetical protein